MSGENLKDEIETGDKIVDRAGAQAAEKLGEINPELALQAGQPKQNTVKLAVDYGPLIAFGLTFLVCRFLKLTDKSEPLIIASGVLGVASLFAFIGGLLLEKRIAWIPLLSALIAIPFSLLTVFFHDTVFVKIKMTIIDVLIGSVLIGGLLLKKQPLKALLGEALKLKETAWPRLTLYYALFYFAMAAINEVVWRTQSDDVWVTWKMISIIGGPVVFSIALLPFLMKNMLVEPDTDGQA
ncbi:MAG: inner membrane-spanning protein YciB [Asticcacaulis sp.]|uniref:inner membrane-spanning protein YciB n=1 Tax=Asticcacaulis sp. TaxID=1872648 RepID=UPI003F7BC7FC